jgi:hypothetical protein
MDITGIGRGMVIGNRGVATQKGSGNHQKSHEQGRGHN